MSNGGKSSGSRGGDGKSTGRGKPPSRGGSSRGSKGGSSRDSRDRRASSATGGYGSGASRSQAPRRRSAAEAIGKGGGVELPRWVHDAMVRVTPKSRIAGALSALEGAAAAFVQGRHRKAHDLAQQAKALSPRDATVRELLGLSSYRMGRWDEALKELRTYRRLSGDTTHIPVEMDTLRALRRPKDVDQAWAQLLERGGSPAVIKEGRVVYASHLLDRGEARRAWDVANPKRLTANPFEEDLRVWYVAAKAAAALDDHEAAARLKAAIVANDPGFPGLEELDVTGGS